MQSFTSGPVITAVQVQSTSVIPTSSASMNKRSLHLHIETRECRPPFQLDRELPAAWVRSLGSTPGTAWNNLVARWQNSPTVSRPHFSWPSCSFFQSLTVCRNAAVAVGFASGLLYWCGPSAFSSTHSVLYMRSEGFYAARVSVPQPIAQTQSTRRTSSHKHVPCPLRHLLFQVGKLHEKPCS